MWERLNDDERKNRQVFRHDIAFDLGNKKSENTRQYACV